MGTPNVSSSSISSPVSSWKYDVFLSFRGEDTRQSFTDHLYAALNRKGIFVFRDDKELKRGKFIRPELFKAIEESRFAIIVFSENYADSTWCLDELVKIVECKNMSNEQMIFPIFYDVEPTMVRNLARNFYLRKRDRVSNVQKLPKWLNAQKLPKGLNAKKLRKWRDALETVASISGWELKDRNESKFIEDIADEISSKLIPQNFESHKELVGINSRVEELMLLLDKGFDDVRMIGIWGMGGLGKTTLARVVYDLISWQFEGKSFIADVRETCSKSRLVSLQKQLLFELLKLKENHVWNVHEGIDMIGSRLRHKKVLIVIDDVVNVRQLESLVGEHNWFGSGSRIIITSRDDHLLSTHGVNEVYKLGGLNGDEAHKLLCLKAFKSLDEPGKDYRHLSERVVQNAGGLPLALTVLGSFLFGRTVQEWESALKRRKRDFDNEILDILKISFDGLTQSEQQIFLDIACFLKGKDKDYVVDILEGFGFEPVIGIRVLIDKSLISINKNVLWMHDLLQEMGHQIIKKESEEPGKRSRLWEEADVNHVLSQNTGTAIIQAIKFDFIKEESNLSATKISKMTNLRLLQINNEQLPGGTSFKELWEGMKCLNMLKVMILSHCQNLIKIPDFTGVSNLEELFVIGCSRLKEIHLHKKLTILYIKDCTSLESLPRMIDMNSLKKLVLSGSSKLKNFPEVGSSMECLSELFLDGTAIGGLPFSFRRMHELVLLSLKDCINLESLPSTTNGLKHLKTLNLSGCSKLKEVPEIVGSMEYLSELFLDGTAIKEVEWPTKLPSSLVLLSLKDCKSLISISSFVISRLKSLRTLNLSGCWKLRKFPEIKEKMEYLSEIYLGGTSIRDLSLPFEYLPCFNDCRLSTTIDGMKFVKTLDLSPRPRTEDWPIHVMRRCSNAMVMLMSPLYGPGFLTKLDLSDSNIGEGAIPFSICNLFSLKTLNLSKNNFVSLPGSISRFSKLKDLLLVDCKRLKYLPEHPSNIENVRVDGCASLEYTMNCLKLADSRPETKRSLTNYGGAKACEDEEPKHKRLRELKLETKRSLTENAGGEACDDEEAQPKRFKRL